MILTHDQSLLAETVRRFLADRYRFEERRKLVETELGFSRENWRLMAELGWLGLPFPEASGGMGGSSLELAVLMESFGRALVVEPYLSTVVLGGGLVQSAGTETQKTTLIPEIAEGRLLVAFAHSEPRSGFDLASVATQAVKSQGGYRLDGRKALVKGAPAADKLIVSARTDVDQEPNSPDGISLFLVDKKASGVTLHSYSTVDGQRAAEVELDGVEVRRTDLLGEPGVAFRGIESVANRAILALGAEAVGAMGALVDSTCEYLKTRHQFGVPLASFQALQHRLVDMYVDYELSRALVFRAAEALEEGPPDEDQARRTVSSVKVQIGTAGKHIGKEAIQLHGGMGMTNELPVGHYFKRLTVIDLELGTAEHHLGLLARSQGRRDSLR